MKQFFLLLTCVVLVLTGTAQRPNKNATRYATTITAGDLKRHLYIVAAPDMEGRETGMPGLRKAADYLIGQFQQMGVQPGNNGSYEQFYPIYRDTLVQAAITINGTAFSFGTDFTAALNSITTSRLYAAEVVLLDRNDTTTEIAGKIVLLAGRQPAMNQLQKISQRQPAAILLAQSGIEKEPSLRSGNFYKNVFRARQTPLYIRISEKMAEALVKGDYAKAKEQGWTTQTYPTQLTLDFVKDVRTTQVSNILAVVEGTDKKDEWVVVTAHYDHVGIIRGQIHPGADDDGSGTVGLLELAEAFAKARAEGRGPRRSILFMAVSGEEKGLWGSEYYSNNPVYPLEKTSININIDMIGRKDDKLGSLDSNNHVYLIGDDKLSTELPRFVDSINTLYTKLILDRKYNDPKDPNRLYFRSDHYNFARKGVPIVFFFDGIHKDYHRPSDTPDKINYDLHEKRTRLVFYLTWDAANRPGMMKRDLPLNVPER
ncbi:MAG TPA: M28 family peptidase [Lacibacter sp.]|nr:M28 family peptidase [Lacibacter sp.]HMO88476.1 M28 family peptidase [Lacibacter sp.]HMP87876.1 M28 family peptidase [Lacibacter sp.]